MYVVYIDDHIDCELRSPVAAELRISELLRNGIEAYTIYDEGACSQP